jgi:hypothetical protein
VFDQVVGILASSLHTIKTQSDRAPHPKRQFVKDEICRTISLYAKGMGTIDFRLQTGRIQASKR